MSFYGTFYHQVDAKNRIRIPARFKGSVPKGEPLYFFKHRDDCFAVMPESALNDMMSFYRNSNPLSAGTDAEQNALTHIYSLIADLEEDNQGRVTIPKLYRDAAHISKDATEIISIGRGSYIEIWSKETFEHCIMSQTLNQAKETAEAKNSQQ